jgi:hypothetical protein
VTTPTKAGDIKHLYCEKSTSSNYFLYLTMEKIYCGNCGHPNLLENNFCNKCGTKLNFDKSSINLIKEEPEIFDNSSVKYQQLQQKLFELAMASGYINLICGEYTIQYLKYKLEDNLYVA